MFLITGEDWLFFVQEIISFFLNTFPSSSGCQSQPLAKLQGLIFINTICDWKSFSLTSNQFLQQEINSFVRKSFHLTGNLFWQEIISFERDLFNLEIDSFGRKLFSLAGNLSLWYRMLQKIEKCKITPGVDSI